MDPARRAPTLADIDALPASIKGEIIEGVLHTMTRPRGPHQNVALIIGADLLGPFQRGRGGTGGWWILPEPGIELPNTPEIAPDIGGWRRERLPTLPEDTAITVVPERIGVRHHWLVDLAARTVTAYRLESAHWVEIGVWGDEAAARIEPFQDVALDVGSWWP